MLAYFDYILKKRIPDARSTVDLIKSTVDRKNQQETSASKWFSGLAGWPTPELIPDIEDDELLKFLGTGKCFIHVEVPHFPGIDS